MTRPATRTEATECQGPARQACPRAARTLSLLFRLLGLLQQRFARRIATVSFVDHAPLTLVECIARRKAAIAFIDHAAGSSRDRGRHRPHEHERSKSGQ